MELRKYKLGDICKNITDGEHGIVVDSLDGKYFLLSNKNIVDGKIVINATKDRRIDKQTFDKINKRTKLEKDDVLISTVGTLGKLCIVEPNFNYTIQRSIGVIKPNQEKLNSNFLKYLLMTNTYQNLLQKTSKGAVQKCIFIDDLKNLNVSIPPLESQQKIAAVLSALDDKIALNRRMNAKLEQMTKRLYDHWFVQFDFPNADGKPYKSSGGKMEYNEVLKREIPAGWEVKRLGEVLFNDIMATEAGEHLRNLEYCPIDEIPMHQMSFAGGKPYTEANSSLQLYEIKDILIGAMRVYFHRCCIAAKPGITRTTTIVLKPFKKNHLAYLYQVCNEDKTFDFAMKVSNGTQQPYVTWKALSEYQFAYPNNEKIIDVFCDKINSVIEKVLENEQEIQKFTALRDRLLPLLMNGQVEVE